MARVGHRCLKDGNGVILQVVVQDETTVGIRGKDGADLRLEPGYTQSGFNSALQCVHTIL